MGFERVVEGNTRKIMVRYKPVGKWFGDSTVGYALPENLKPLED